MYANKRYLVDVDPRDSIDTSPFKILENKVTLAYPCRETCFRIQGHDEVNVSDQKQETNFMTTNYQRKTSSKKV